MCLIFAFILIINTFNQNIKLTAMEMALTEIFCSYEKMPLFSLLTFINTL